MTILDMLLCVVVFAMAAVWAWPRIVMLRGRPGGVRIGRALVPQPEQERRLDLDLFRARMIPTTGLVSSTAQALESQDPKPPVQIRREGFAIRMQLTAPCPGGHAPIERVTVVARDPRAAKAAADALWKNGMRILCPACGSAAPATGKHEAWKGSAAEWDGQP